MLITSLELCLDGGRELQTVDAFSCPGMFPPCPDWRPRLGTRQTKGNCGVLVLIFLDLHHASR